MLTYTVDVLKYFFLYEKADFKSFFKNVIIS